jgi:hypothetical protein
VRGRRRWERRRPEGPYLESFAVAVHPKTGFLLPRSGVMLAVRLPVERGYLRIGVSISDYSFSEGRTSWSFEIYGMRARDDHVVPFMNVQVGNQSKPQFGFDVKNCLSVSVVFRFGYRKPAAAHWRLSRSDLLSSLWTCRSEPLALALTIESERPCKMPPQRPTRVPPPVQLLPIPSPVQ